MTTPEPKKDLLPEGFVEMSSEEKITEIKQLFDALSNEDKIKVYEYVMKMVTITEITKNFDVIPSELKQALFDYVIERIPKTE